MNLELVLSVASQAAHGGYFVYARTRVNTELRYGTGYVGKTIAPRDYVLDIFLTLTDFLRIVGAYAVFVLKTGKLFDNIGNPMHFTLQVVLISRNFT